MLHFLAKRAVFVFAMCLHLSWGTVLLTRPYPSPYGSLEALVTLYGPEVTGWLLIGTSLCAALGIFVVYFQEVSRVAALVWVLPQQFLLLYMAGQTLQTFLMTPANTRALLAFGYLLPAAVLHGVTIIDHYQRRPLEQALAGLRRLHA